MEAHRPTRRRQRQQSTALVAADGLDPDTGMSGQLPDREPQCVLFGVMAKERHPARRGMTGHDPMPRTRIRGGVDLRQMARGTRA